MKRENYFLTTLIVGSIAAVAHPCEAAGQDEALPDLVYRSNGVYSVLEAAAAGNEGVLQARIREGCNVNQVDEEGNTALHLAARAGKVNCIKLLLHAGADPMMQGPGGKTALDWATSQKAARVLEAAMAARSREVKLCEHVQAGNFQALESALEQKGFNPNFMNSDNTRSLLMIVCGKGKVDLAKQLIQAGADVNFVAPDTRSVLHVAVDADNAAIIPALLAAGANPMVQAGNGATPLHDAVWSRRKESVRALLPAYKDINFSPDGRHNGIPIGLAIGRNFPDMVQLFIDAGMDLNDPELPNQPLIHAARNGRREIVEMLLKAGADKNIRNREGKTAKDVAKGSILNLL